MRPLPWLRENAGRAALAGAAAAVLLGLWALLAPARAPLAGWLVGLVFWIGIGLGALGLLAIRALTGGKWAGSLRPALGPAAASLPFFLLACLPLLFGLHALYPWASDPGLLPVEDIPRLYLNPDGFALRTLLALAGWSALGWWLLWRPGAVSGGLGLTFHLVAISLISVDWMLSLEPRFFSTAFGLATFLMQLLAALAWAAVLRPEREGDEPGRAGDLAGLLYSAALGSLYLGFAQFLVSWYGNLPEKAAWFVKREEWGWIWLQGVSLALAAALPLAAILLGRVRRSPAALARLGPPVLLGIAAHQAWIVAPAVGPWALPAAALGLVAVGGLWVGLAYGPVAARLEAKHGRA